MKTVTNSTPDPTDPTCWLNYKGDVRGNVPQVMGPDQNGELLYPVVVEYDTETNRSRVGLSRIVPQP